jgi:hypothetical protein
VALQTERAHVGQIAFSAAFSDWSDVIGVPQAFSSSQSPFSHCFGASASAQALYVLELCDAVDAANGADAAVAFENALPHIAGIGA